MTAPSSTPLEAGPLPTFTGSIRLRLRVPARMRNLELLLLLIACGINAGAILLVQLGALGHLDWNLAGLGIGLSVLVLAMHIALRFVATDADPSFCPSPPCSTASASP